MFGLILFPTFACPKVSPVSPPASSTQLCRFTQQSSLSWRVGKDRSFQRFPSESTFSGQNVMKQENPSGQKGAGQAGKPPG